MDGIEFDWDAGNIQHLADHALTPVEFERLIGNDPVDLDYEVTSGEERYRSVGLTNGGRFLTAVWTVRRGKVRAVTVFPAGAREKKTFLERSL